MKRTYLIGLLFLLVFQTRASAGSLALPTLSCEPNPVAPGGRASCVLLIQNGADDERKVVTTLTFDPNLTFKGADPSSLGGNVWFFDVDEHGTGQIRFEVEVSASATPGTTLNISASASDDGGQTATLSGGPKVAADGGMTPLKVATINCLPDPVAPEGTFACSALVLNGGAVSRFVVVTITPDADATMVGSDPPAAGGNNWAFPSVEAGEQETIHFEMKVKAGVTDGTTLTMQASATDNFGGTAMQTGTIKVKDGAPSTPLSLAGISCAPNPVAPGGRFSCLAFVRNDGAVERDIVVTTTYDADSQFLQSEPSPDLGTTNRWTFDDVEPGDSETVRVELQVLPSAIDGSQLTLQASATDNLGGDVDRSATLDVESGAANTPLGLSAIACHPNPVAPGDELHCGISVINNGVATRLVTLLLNRSPELLFTSSDPSSAGSAWVFFGMEGGDSEHVDIDFLVGPAMAGTTLSLTATAADTVGGNVVKSGAVTVGCSGGVCTPTPSPTPPATGVPTATATATPTYVPFCSSEICSQVQEAEARCPCAAAATHGRHVRCVSALGRELFKQGRFCARDLRLCASRSICGRPGSVTCTIRGKCLIKRSADKCVAAGGVVGTGQSCCDEACNDL